MKQLGSLFIEVAHEFFPRWHHNGWKIRTEKCIRPGQGWCDRENKTIFGNFLDYEKNRFDAFMIHELCHVVTTDSHGSKFYNRLNKALDRSKQIGRPELAEILQRDISCRKTRREVKSSGVNETIEEILIYNPWVSWKEIKSYFLDRFSISPRHFNSIFKDAQNFFKKKKNNSSKDKKKALKKEAKKYEETNSYQRRSHFSEEIHIENNSSPHDGCLT